MNILGLNSGRAAPISIDPSYNRPLADGCSAVIKDNNISAAMIEERLSGIRYDCGFSKSSLACLKQAKVKPEEVENIAFTSCCDIKWSSQADLLSYIDQSWQNEGILSNLSETFKGEISFVDHHESHAMLSFVASQFKRALVCVLDGLGNKRQPERFDISSNWWNGAFQYHTYYIAKWEDNRVILTKIHEDEVAIGKVGLGELYRAVTHYLGWPSYQFSGKTMALSAYGDPKILSKARFVEFSRNEGIKVKINNLHNDPLSQINDVLTKAEIVIPKYSNNQANSSHEFQNNLAATIQSQLEVALRQMVEYLSDKYQIKNVCFGGGVAMNCVALGKIYTHNPFLNLFVPSAPSDTGQGLGAALWMANSDKSPIASNSIAVTENVNSPFWGPVYPKKDIDCTVTQWIKDNPRFTASKLSKQKLAEIACKALVANEVVAIRNGRSELGPRALGHSSIIASPKDIQMKEKVNNIKRREQFRPFAPVILQEKLAEFFEPAPASPYMSFAANVKPEKKHLLQAVIHIDGTARYQSLEADNSLYRAILENFYNITQIPVLLNTSYNLAGKPLAESPTDALESFKQMAPLGLAKLIIEDWLIETKHTQTRNHYV